MTDPLKAIVDAAVARACAEPGEQRHILRMMQKTARHAAEAALDLAMSKIHLPREPVEEDEPYWESGNMDDCYSYGCDLTAQRIYARIRALKADMAEDDPCDEEEE